VQDFRRIAELLVDDRFHDCSSPNLDLKIGFSRECPELRRIVLRVDRDITPDLGLTCQDVSRGLVFRRQCILHVHADVPRQ